MIVRSEEKIKRVQNRISRTFDTAMMIGLENEAASLLALLDLIKWLLGESCPTFQKLIDRWHQLDVEETEWRKSHGSSN